MISSQGTFLNFKVGSIKNKIWVCSRAKLLTLKQLFNTNNNWGHTLPKKIKIIFFLFSISLIFSFSVQSVIGLLYDGAWFTHIVVTNGSGEIDLINGGTATVYDGQELEIRLIYYNDGCGVFGSDLYTRIYVDGENKHTSNETYVWKGETDTDSSFYTVSGKKILSCKAELWWETGKTGGVHLLVDVKEFTVKIVRLEVVNWNPSSLSIARGFDSGDLAITFTNGGNDFMYDVKISVLDSAGLTVDPQTQQLGDINDGGTKTAVISVQADRDKEATDYPITLEVVYDDLRGVTHTETYQANLSVTSNFIKENLNMLRIIVAVIVIAVIAGILYKTISGKSKKP